MTTTIQIKRDTAANWTSSARILAAGQFGYETDTGKFKIGDGSTAWASLGYKGGPISAFMLTVNDDTTAPLALATLGVSPAAVTMLALSDVIGLSITTGTPLTNSQIINLPTTPVSINIAPSTGYIALPKHVYVKVNSNAGVYGTIDPGCEIQFTYTSGKRLIESITGGDVNILLATGTAGGDAAIVGTRSGSEAGLLSQFEANALRISADNQGAGVFSGGHSSNSGLVKVEWTLVPVS